MPFQIAPKLLKNFKGFCSCPEVILLFVYMKCRFSLSYRELEEMAYIRGAVIDHSHLCRDGLKDSGSLIVCVETEKWYNSEID